jgi:hypothetical protein
VATSQRKAGPGQSASRPVGRATSPGGDPPAAGGRGDAASGGPIRAAASGPRSAAGDSRAAASGGRGKPGAAARGTRGEPGSAGAASDDSRASAEKARPGGPLTPGVLTGDFPASLGPGAIGAGLGGRSAQRERPRMPPVRLAPREELAAAARVAPVLRAAADLEAWVSGVTGQPGDGASDVLTPAQASAASVGLELTPTEVDAAWRVVVAMRHQSAGSTNGIARWDAGEVLGAWDSALAAILDAEELDGLATALYTVGAPVRIDALFDAYTAAAGSPRPEPEGAAQYGVVPEPDEAAALSRALETLADLGVVELGTEETAGGLTVALSPLGIWGVHRRLRGQGWHVPVLGSAGRDGAVGLLKTLASCDAEDGETEIGTWLGGRTPGVAAQELIRAAATGSPGLRGAAFAVLDRIGGEAIVHVRAAMADPLLRAHAAVWLHEHDEPAELQPADRTWLLVDLGAGLLEEADPRDVVAELLPEVPAQAQAEIVAGLWRVDHPAIIDLLTALSEHHPDPAVARAARKAAFKARSPGAGQIRPGSSARRTS